MKWLEELKFEELPEVCKALVELLKEKFPDIPHMPVTMTIALHYNKQNLYFGNIDNLIKIKKEEYIKKNYDPAHPWQSKKKLARETELSERRVYDILRQVQDDTQEAMF